MSKILEAFLVLILGIVLLPPIKSILDQFDTELLPHGIMSEFEEVVFDIYPIAILAAVLLGVVLIFIKKNKKKEED